MLPKITRMATALYQGNNPGAVIIIDDVQRKGEQIGLEFRAASGERRTGPCSAFDSATKAKAQALFVMDDGAMTEQRQRILELR